MDSELKGREESSRPQQTGTLAEGVSEPTGGERLFAASTASRFQDGTAGARSKPALAVVHAVESPRRRIVAVGGGKGGIGKSLITSSLAICLARRGLKVVLVDADLGGANLHTALGLTAPELTLADFIHRRVGSIGEVIADTGIDNLGLITGAHDFLTASNLKYQQKARLLSRIRTVAADYILLDIGAGISFNIVDFFLLAEVDILLVVPEPSSIENAYRFLKMSFYRNLRMAVKEEGIRAVIDQAMDQKNLRGIRTPFDLLETVERLDQSAGRLLKERALSFRPKLIVNQIRYPEDERLGAAMASVCHKHLGVEMNCLGSVCYDDGVWQAHRRKKPFMLVYPESRAARSIEQAAASLVLPSQV